MWHRDIRSVREMPHHRQNKNRQQAGTASVESKNFISSNTRADDGPMLY